MEVAVRDDHHEIELNRAWCFEKGVWQVYEAAMVCIGLEYFTF